ncbi:hypothetical protein B0H16DRAFT_1480700 [Mycena metata]|uniref:Uncharacterized protein n=1 Tax=Mycena metata TaxID=1033252 RepID=A0AAD7H1N2_9AGAR|nr:hypothetical protein B0H16DRAFT_1480700 [Mycena metata]
MRTFYRVKDPQVRSKLRTRWASRTSSPIFKRTLRGIFVVLPSPTDAHMQHTRPKFSNTIELTLIARKFTQKTASRGNKSDPKCGHFSFENGPPDRNAYEFGPKRHVRKWPNPRNLDRTSNHICRGPGATLAATVVRGRKLVKDSKTQSTPCTTLHTPLPQRLSRGWEFWV